MKRISGIIILLLSGITGIKSQDNVLIKVSTSVEITPFTEGYINRSGDTIIPIGKYSYCFTEEFDNIAFVGIKGLPGVYAINRKEDVLFRVATLDNGPDPVNDGLFRIIKNNKTGFANMKGEIVIQPYFDSALPFKDGFAVVCVGGKDEKDGDYTLHVGGKWGLVNTVGEVVVEPKYNGIHLLGNGYAKVRIGGTYDGEGNHLKLNGGKWGLINTTGNEILEPFYDDIQIQEDGKIRLKIDGEWRTN